MIDKQDVVVVGDKLSEVQKTEIEQKAILTLPVKLNGKFRFAYNNIEPRIGLKYKIAPNNTSSAAYGLHSCREKLDYYFVKIDGKSVNKDL